MYGYSAARNRYTVLLANNQHVAFRPEHLEVCTAQAGESSQVPHRRVPIMEKAAAFDEYMRCMGQATLLETGDLGGMPGPTSAAEGFGKAAKLGAVVGDAGYGARPPGRLDRRSRRPLMSDVCPRFRLPFAARRGARLLRGRRQSLSV